MYKIGQRAFGEKNVAPADIWSYENYHMFDVIYYFRPFHDGAIQRRFEHFIEDTIKTGGILIANRKMSDRINSDNRFRRLHNELPVWEKIKE